MAASHQNPSGKRILIVCPAGSSTQFGNRIRALRYQSIFQQLGYWTRIEDHLLGVYDIAVVLHAFRSADSIAESKSRYPLRPVVLVITGTDLYRYGQTAACRTSIKLSDRIVVSQPTMVDDLPKQYRGKTHTIFQSSRPLAIRRPKRPRSLRVVVAGHLREVKDPFRTAMAIRQLPDVSRIVVDHYGAALDDSMKRRATEEMKRNPRYRWHGEILRGEFRRKLATAWLMVLSSKMEGGANVLSEAIAVGTPVLASRISGSTGLLGENYGGLFEVGDTRGLRRLLLTCETDPKYYGLLQQQTAKRARLVEPARELNAWRKLFARI